MEKKIKGGATIWARQTIGSDIFFWKPDKWFKIWFYIVNKVNHTDTKLFKKGSNFMTYEEIMLQTKSKRAQVDGLIRYAKKNQMLTTQKTTRGMIVFVSKFNFFQDFNNYKTTQKQKHKRNINETQTKHKRNINDTINNNDNNDNNDNNKKNESNSLQDESCGKQINFLIEKFKPINPSYKILFANTTQRKVLERMIKEYTYKEVGKMIDALPEIVTQKYAPQISTPVQLENKLGQLLIFVKQNEKKGLTVIKT